MSSAPRPPQSITIPIDGPRQSDLRSAVGFLKGVFLGAEQGVVNLFCKPGNSSSFFRLDERDWQFRAASKAIELRDSSNIYFSLGLQPAKPKKGRGQAATVAVVTGFAVDIDVLGPNHACRDLPPTYDHAMRLVGAFPLKPTVIVHTGGGVQLFWLLKQPWVFRSDDERKEAAALSRALYRFLQSKAQASGWNIDNTSDLSHLYRLPGTYNRKQAEPFLVRYEKSEDGRRYDPPELMEAVKHEIGPDTDNFAVSHAPQPGTADFNLLRAGCAWTRHCIDHAETLAEPEWYRFLSLCVHCHDGEQLAHEFSRKHPKYSERETNEKLKHAMGAAGPVTCAFIASDLGCERFCAECADRGRFTSPIQLGSAPRRNELHAEGPHNVPPGSELPSIQVNDRQLRDLVGDSFAALRAINQPPFIFVRAGRTVFIDEDENRCHTITEARPDNMTNWLTRSADFYRIEKRRVNCDPPDKMVRSILATKLRDCGFPPLEGIIEAPALRHDGTIITAPGYDQQSRLYLIPNDANMPEIPECPNPEDVRHAIWMLDDVICDFPFFDDASRANFIAALLTPIVRPAIHGPTPLALFDATTQGTGKTLLAELVSLIFRGREAAMFSAPGGKSEEWRKALTAILLEGPSIVVIDNVSSRLDNADLCKALTETTHGDRVLGKSETVNVRVRCAWIATGNNIQVGGDMPRRCYWIRLEAKCAKPFERTGFRHPNLKEYVRERRGELLWAMLTLSRAWFAAGRPKPDRPPLGSYEEWSVIVGGILENAGIRGFLENAKDLYDQADSDSAQIETFLIALHDEFHDRPFTSKQVKVRLGQYFARNECTEATEQTLRDALPEFLVGDRDDKVLSAQRLGLTFKQFQGRRFGDAQIRIERVGENKHSKVAFWKVVRSD